MRKQLLGVFLPLLVVLLAAAETQNTGTEVAKRAAVQKVNVVRVDDGIQVEITAKGQVVPSLTTLDRPSRLVLDLPNTVMATAQSRISVESGEVKGVRVGMDGQTPPTTRIVVDLAQACHYELVPSEDHKLVLKVYTTSSTAKVTPKHKATQKTVAAAPAATTTVPAAPAPAPVVAKAVAPQPEQKAAKSATDFVFVEPSYSAKDEQATKPAVDAQPVRAVDAAAKFVEKPEGQLMPPVSASMNPQEAKTASQPAVNMAAEQKMQAQQAPAVTGPKYTGETISVNLKDVDLKDFFRLIHEISGLNVVLDPNVKGSLTIVLDDVPWDQALDIVLKNNELGRQLEGNVLRIATIETMRKEAEARRAQQEAEALAVEKVTVTRFLSYAHSKDVVPTLKNFLSQRGDVISDDRTNALIIQDIPSVMPAIDRLLTQLDRKTQEVEIEARVVAATRSFARDIGTQMAIGWGNGHSAIGGDQSVGSTPTGVGTGLVPTPLYPITSSGGGTGSTIPLFSNFPVTQPTSGFQFLNFSNNFRIDFILTMAESRGLLKILSRPRVVTQNNIQALVRQGVRVPIVTQAQLGGP